MSSVIDQLRAMHERREQEEAIAANNRLKHEESLRALHPVLRPYSYKCTSCQKLHDHIGYAYTARDPEGCSIHFCNIDCAQKWEAAQEKDPEVSDRRAAIEATRAKSNDD